jgi:hypothetical protein
MCHGQVIGSALRKARTPKRCTECRSEIEPGEVYSRWAWAADGELQEIHVHLRCHAMIDEASDQADDQCIVGGAQTYLREAVSNTNGWRELRASLRRGVDRLLERYKEGR